MSINKKSCFDFPFIEQMCEKMGILKYEIHERNLVLKPLEIRQIQTNGTIWFLNGVSGDLVVENRCAIYDEQGSNLDELDTLFQQDFIITNNDNVLNHAAFIQIVITGLKNRTTKTN